MNKLRWRSVVLGAAVFLVAHAVLVARWTAWFGPDWTPWFQNSGRAVLFTMACLVVAGLVAGVLAPDRHETIVHAGNIAAGAISAMIVILFAVVGIAGLFPIAIALGIMLIVVSSFAGALIAYPLKRG